MTDLYEYPDSMPDIRDWLGGHPLIHPLLPAGKVFFQLPVKPSGAPLIRVYRSGGGPQANTDIPMEDIRVAIEIWGMQGSDYEAIRQVERAIKTAALQVQPLTILGALGTMIRDIRITTFVDSPDPDTGWPRLVGDSLWEVTLANGF